ncbi:hypothetical protein B484DRAFT_451536, partial [Ochromonadaceae sp. CCMP2298]
MKPFLSRIGKKKDWNKVYVDRLEYNKESKEFDRELIAQDEAEKAPKAAQASKFINELITTIGDSAKQIQQSKNTGRVLSRHTLDTCPAPKKHESWTRGWGSQVLCDMCAVPCITESTICGKCDVITHNQCILDTGRQIDGYDCPDCLESVHAEDSYYEHLLLRLAKQRKQEVDFSKITRRLVIMAERNRIARKKRSVIMLQSLVRRYLDRREYVRYLRSQMRLLILHMTQLPPNLLDGTCIIVVSIYDTLKNQQSYRLDATAEQAQKQGFLIPGLGANSTLLFTAAKEEYNKDGGKHYVMFGQAQLNVRDVFDFMKKKVFRINFVDKIKYPPLEIKGEFKFHLVPHPVVAALAASNGATVTSMGASVGWEAQSHSPPHHVQFASSSSSAKSGEGGAAVLNPLSRVMFASQRSFTVVYEPQNPVTTMVALCTGPPLDILKRASDIGIKKVKSGGTGITYRNSRYWLCLYRMKLLLYQYYGDIAPRLVSDVSEATAVMLRDNKGRKTTLVNIVHGDMRVWLL